MGGPEICEKDIAGKQLKYVRVSIPKSPLKALTYSQPPEMISLESGMRVVVPLHNRFASGFVIETDSPLEKGIEPKPVADLIDTENLFTPNLLKLTRWMADYYLAEWADLLKAAIPPALEIRPQTMILITPKGIRESSEHAILRMLREKKNLPLGKIYELFGYRGTFSQLRKMEQEGWIDIRAAKPKTRAAYNMVEIIEASSPPENPKELVFYNYLVKQKRPVPIEEVREHFSTAAAFIRKMKISGKLRTFWLPSSQRVFWPNLDSVEELNHVQKQARDRIVQSLNQFSVFLLHGVTGSGKTEIYLRVAKKVLGEGKTVLILVPEIALLPLMVRRVEKTLRVPVSILHSELGERERLEEWKKAREGKVRVVIGTRSALFAPLQNPGLIVIDEEHDGSYKQGEYPRYHARESAIMRANFEGCPILLGSATPSIESFYNAGNGKYVYLSLPERVEKRSLPEVQLIDMKQEYRQTGDPVFSHRLIEAIHEALQRKEQILILQNRRGYASWLMCRLCGNVLECPHCSTSLTYHKIPSRMICHLCDYSRLVPSKCEKCGSLYLHLFGVGTQKISEALKNKLPQARIVRFDRDSTKKAGTIAKILTKFAHHEIDMLVGTQMLAKGHDFPNITLVGIVGADSSIGIPDFRASERLFQLITQVSGRSGRGKKQGSVVVQTFHPDHYAIQCAIRHSYEDFYEKESRFRRLMQFPPYINLANILFSGKEAKQTLDLAREFGKLILAFKAQTIKIVGPAIAPVARISGKYRFQILVKSPSRKNLRDCLRTALQKFEENHGSASLPSIDIDPYSIV